MPNCHRLLRERLPQIPTDAVLEFVGNPRVLKIGRRVDFRSALERDHRKSGIRQGFGHDGAGPSVPDDYRIDGFLPLGHHALTPLMETGP